MGLLSVIVIYDIMGKIVWLENRPRFPSKPLYKAITHNLNYFGPRHATFFYPEPL